MDVDLQDDPNEIISLYKMIQHEGYELVSGWKRKRLNPLSKTMPQNYIIGLHVLCLVQNYMILIVG